MQLKLFKAVVISLFLFNILLGFGAALNYPIKYIVLFVGLAFVLLIYSLSKKGFDSSTKNDLEIRIVSKSETGSRSYMAIVQCLFWFLILNGVGQRSELVLWLLIIFVIALLIGLFIYIRKREANINPILPWYFVVVLSGLVTVFFSIYPGFGA
ncbi:MAG: hypothetical protein ABIV51_13520 [Saprospiraceae bacterium]